MATIGPQVMTRWTRVTVRMATVALTRHPQACDLSLNPARQSLMSSRKDRATWEPNYFFKIIQLLDDYPKCFIVGTDAVGSKQRQQTCMSLPGRPWG